MGMNRKGQALIEFVLILPVFLLILFVVVDFGNLLYSKNQLENQSTDIILSLKKGESIDVVKSDYPKIDIVKSQYKEGTCKVDLKKNLTLINPLLHRILGNPCTIEVERIVPCDE